MDSNQSKAGKDTPITTKSPNIIVLTPDELTKMGILQQVEVAIKNIPQTPQNKRKTKSLFKSKRETDGDKILSSSDFIEVEDHDDNVTSNYKNHSDTIDLSKTVSGNKSNIRHIVEDHIETNKIKDQKVNVISSTPVHLSTCQIQKLLSLKKSTNTSQKSINLQETATCVRDLQKGNTGKTENYLVDEVSKIENIDSEETGTSRVLSVDTTQNSAEDCKGIDDRKIMPEMHCIERNIYNSSDSYSGTVNNDLAIFPSTSKELPNNADYKELCENIKEIFKSGKSVATSKILKKKDANRKIQSPKLLKPVGFVRKNNIVEKEYQLHDQNQIKTIQKGKKGIDIDLSKNLPNEEISVLKKKVYGKSEKQIGHSNELPLSKNVTTQSIDLGHKTDIKMSDSEYEDHQPLIKMKVELPDTPANTKHKSEKKLNINVQSQYVSDKNQVFKIKSDDQKVKNDKFMEEKEQINECDRQLSKEEIGKEDELKTNSTMLQTIRGHTKNTLLVTTESTSSDSKNFVNPGVNISNNYHENMGHPIQNNVSENKDISASGNQQNWENSLIPINIKKKRGRPSKNSHTDPLVKKECDKGRGVELKESSNSKPNPVEDIPMIKNNCRQRKSSSQNEPQNKNEVFLTENSARKDRKEKNNYSVMNSPEHEPVSGQNVSEEKLDNLTESNNLVTLPLVEKVDGKGINENLNPHQDPIVDIPIIKTKSRQNKHFSENIIEKKEKWVTIESKVTERNNLISVSLVEMECDRDINISSNIEHDPILDKISITKSNGRQKKSLSQNKTENKNEATINENNVTDSNNLITFPLVEKEHDKEINESLSMEQNPVLDKTPILKMNCRQIVTETENKVPVTENTPEYELVSDNILSKEKYDKVTESNNLITVPQAQKECEREINTSSNTEENRNLGIPIIKKRGRPRKSLLQNAMQTKNEVTITENSAYGRKRKRINYSVMNSPENEHIISNTLSDEQYINITESNNSVTAPLLEKDGKREISSNTEQNQKVHNPIIKKKGRPRKDLSQNLTENKKQVTLFEDSVYGRKRKRINYSAMDSPEHEPISDSELKYNNVTGTNDLIKPKKKFKRISCDRVKEQDTYLLENSKNQETLSQDILDIKEENVTLYDAEQVAPLMDSLDGQETLKTTISDAIPKPKKGSKKVRTGATTKMLTTLFATSRMEVTEDSDVKDTPVVKPKADGTVVCMVCKQNVKAKAWKNHKNKIHYSLAWTDGESPLDISNKKFVYKKLVEFENKYGKLKCHKCGTKPKDVEKFIDHMNECNSIVSDGYVTCAICRKSLPKTHWSIHKLRYHNNLAWREGETPLNLNDQAFVMSVLNSIYKERKPLHCEKCDIPKKSVVGYLSHKSICKKTLAELEEIKVSCELCGMRMMPVSMESHMRTVHTNKPDKVKSESKYFDVVNNVSNTKRKAAEKAVQLINQTENGLTVQLQDKYYVYQPDFKEEEFVINILNTQRIESEVRCKFKDCSYVDSSASNLIEHMCKCMYKPSEWYCCRKCLAIYESEFEMIEHFKNDHDVTINKDKDFIANSDMEDEDDDQAIECQQKLIKNKMETEREKQEKDPTYKVTPRCIVNLRKRNPNIIFPYSYEWTKQFCDQNYFQTKIFNKFRINDNKWQLLDPELLSDYLPSVHQSCVVSDKTITEEDNIEKMEYKYTTLDLFESATNSKGSIVTMFCGGPISAMAWLPTPQTKLDCDQFLAVSVLSDPDQSYDIHENYPGPSVIQFWNLGTLRNRSELGSMSKPKSMFGLAHNYGPVWGMEWCPSGCYDMEEDANGHRILGLLALAGSVPAVPVFVIDSVEEHGIFYKKDPVLELELETDYDSVLEKHKYYPTRISWTKASGHEYIAVGYTSGVIALYCLTNESILLRKNRLKQSKLFPCKIFQAHLSYITAICLNHLGGGNRYLMSTSYDRYCIVWDLHTCSKISINTKKHVVPDAAWMMNWLSCIYSQCESDGGIVDNINTHGKFIRSFLSENVNLAFSLSTINCISTSDWLNSFIQGSACGDIIGVFPSQLLAKVGGEKTGKRLRLLFAKALLQDKLKEGMSESSSEDTTNTAVTYAEAVKKYKLLFLDYNLEEDRNFPKSVNSSGFSGNAGRLKTCRQDEYNLNAINKIAYNPNFQSTTFFATGYEAGFVRITRASFLESNQQVV